MLAFVNLTRTNEEAPVCQQHQDLGFRGICTSGLFSISFQYRSIAVELGCHLLTPCFLAENRTKMKFQICHLCA